MPDYENPEDFECLQDAIRFDGFDYTHYYRDEKLVLTPRLEALGFTDIEFSMGEVDSFGPLIRLCHATAADGKRHKFFYG